MKCIAYNGGYKYQLKEPYAITSFTVRLLIVCFRKCAKRTACGLFLPGALTRGFDSSATRRPIILTSGQ